MGPATGLSCPHSLVADGPLEADALRALKEALRVELCVLALYLLGQWLRGALMKNASRARAVVVVAAESEVSDLLYMRICVESIYARDCEFQSMAWTTPEPASLAASKRRNNETKRIRTITSESGQVYRCGDRRV